MVEVHFTCSVAYMPCFGSKIFDDSSTIWPGLTKSGLFRKTRSKWTLTLFRGVACTVSRAVLLVMEMRLTPGRAVPVERLRHDL